MYRIILIPLALDQGYASQAVELARTLKTPEGKIIALHVIDQVPGFSNYYLSQGNEEAIQESAKKRITERIAGAADIETVVLTGHSGRTITDYAERIGADCIIVGSHKPDLKDFFLGSTAARVMRYAKCSVHVVRPDQSNGESNETPV